MWKIVFLRRVVREIRANRWANLPVLFWGQYLLPSRVSCGLRLREGESLLVEYSVFVLAGESLSADSAYTAHLTETTNVERSL